MAASNTALSAYPSTLPNDPDWGQHLREALGNRSRFVEPDGGIHYTDYRYVGSHNAFTYHRFFNYLRQQDQTIIGQLTFGVRGLMLDTYDWNTNPTIGSRVGTGTVVLSHPDLGFASKAQKTGTEYQTLKFELRRVIEFMKVNRDAVVTIFLEDYANGAVTATEIKEAIAEAYGDNNPHLLFKPSDLQSPSPLGFGGISGVDGSGLGGDPNAPVWDPMSFRFPTLGEMRAADHRLVIFTQRAATTDVTFRQFTYCIENSYSTMDWSDLIKERPESSSEPASPERQVVVFNNMPGIAEGSGVAADLLFADAPAGTPFLHFANKYRDALKFETLSQLSTRARRVGFAQGRLMNGYWPDRIIDCVTWLESKNEKTAFDYVNRLNRDRAPSFTPVRSGGTGYFFALAADPDRAITGWHGSGSYYYAGSKLGAPIKHEIHRAPGMVDKDLYPADQVFLRNTQSNMGDQVYLNSETEFNLLYSKNRGGDEAWMVERVDTSIKGPIRAGERVRLKSTRQTSDKGHAMYLSAEQDDDLGTRSATDTDSRNLGTIWLITDAW